MSREAGTGFTGRQDSLTHLEQHWMTAKEQPPSRTSLSESDNVTISHSSLCLYSLFSFEMKMFGGSDTVNAHSLE